MTLTSFLEIADFYKLQSKLVTHFKRTRSSGYFITLRDEVAFQKRSIEKLNTQLELFQQLMNVNLKEVKVSAEDSCMILKNSGLVLIHRYPCFGNSCNEGRVKAE
jgi:hypothetical protein